ncbi:uncharacterized protein [Manis javanica]|uniref:uncharacterized protein n=1 Tax=Manis javanica TaxID=9974 RepID=UPI003C6CF0B1
MPPQPCARRRWLGAGKEAEGAAVLPAPRPAGAVSPAGPRRGPPAAARAQNSPGAALPRGRGYSRTAAGGLWALGSGWKEGPAGGSVLGRRPPLQFRLRKQRSSEAQGCRGEWEPRAPRREGPEPRAGCSPSPHPCVPRCSRKVPPPACRTRIRPAAPTRLRSPRGPRCAPPAPRRHSGTTRPRTPAQGSAETGTPPAAPRAPRPAQPRGRGQRGGSWPPAGVGEARGESRAALGCRPAIGAPSPAPRVPTRPPFPVRRAPLPAPRPAHAGTRPGPPGAGPELSHLPPGPRGLAGAAGERRPGGGRGPAGSLHGALQRLAGACRPPFPSALRTDAPWRGPWGRRAEEGGDGGRRDASRGGWRNPGPPSARPLASPTRCEGPLLQATGPRRHSPPSREPRRLAPASPRSGASWAPGYSLGSPWGGLGLTLRGVGGGGTEEKPHFTLQSPPPVGSFLSPRWPAEAPLRGAKPRSPRLEDPVSRPPWPSVSSNIAPQERQAIRRGSRQGPDSAFTREELPSGV